MTGIVDIHGKPMGRTGSTLHQLAEKFERDEVRAWGVIAVLHDGTVECNVGRETSDGDSLKLIAQGCGTIVGHLRAENARSFAPDPDA